MNTVTIPAQAGFLPTVPLNAPPVVVASDLPSDGLSYLKRLILSDYQKHLFGLVDPFCNDFELIEIQRICQILAEETPSVLSGLDHRYLLDYVSQRMEMICRFNQSLLASVERDELFFALNAVRLQLLGVTTLTTVLV